MSPYLGALDHVTATREQGVLRLTLDRADASNALTVAMRDRLLATIRAGRADDEVRCVLVDAAGPAFCSGMDLRQSTVARVGDESFDPRSTSEALRVGVHAIVRELWELDKPTVAAVGGAAVGPGAHLALACDLVVASTAASFAWSFSTIGLVVDAGGAYLLPRLVGLARAKELVLLSERLDATAAAEAGLVGRVVAPDELAGTTTELARRLASGPTRALGLSKRLLNTSFERDLSTSLEAEAQAQALATASRDLVEGLAAFGERRAPRFGGH